MFPSKIHFPSDSTTAILKDIYSVYKSKEKVARYEYEDGYYFKGTSITFSESEIEGLIKKGIIKR